MSSQPPVAAVPAAPAARRAAAAPEPARLLLIAAPNSYRTFAYIDAARRGGVDVLVATPGQHSLVTTMVGGIHVDLNHPQAIERLLEAARERPFAGVVATDDAAVELTSRVAHALGLAHNPPESARLSRRKDLARACLAAAGLPVPAHCLIDLREPLASQLQDMQFPCVVKPLALSASRGVIRVDNPEQLFQACARISAILADAFPADEFERDNILVEAFIPGREIAVEGLLHAGELSVLAVFDKPDPLNGPFFEETYYLTPSRLAPQTLRLAERRVQEACTAYGLREGPVHAELRLHADDAWLVELASRTIGGHCGRLLQFGTGTTLEDLVIAHAMGQKPALAASTGAAGVLMIPIPRAGVLRRVEGVLAARRIPFIEDIEISLREGYELVPLPEGSQYLGFVFARAPTAAQVEAALRAAHANLNIVVAPLFRIAAATAGSAWDYPESAPI